MRAFVLGPAALCLAGALMPARAVEPLAPVEITEWEVPYGGSRPRDPYVQDADTVWFVGQRGDYLARFDVGAAAFEKEDKRTVQAQQRRVSELEAKLKKKDTVIAEIMEDLIAEKKGRGAPSLYRNTDTSGARSKRNRWERQSSCL